MIAGVVLAAVFVLGLLLAWRSDRRHGRRRVGDRSADMEIGLAETRFDSQNPGGNRVI